MLLEIPFYRGEKGGRKAPVYSSVVGRKGGRWTRWGRRRKIYWGREVKVWEVSR
jgi:hypothetical protein